MFKLNLLKSLTPMVILIGILLRLNKFNNGPLRGNIHQGDEDLELNLEDCNVDE